jgi:lysophospholipase L1-like esterase
MADVFLMAAQLLASSMTDSGPPSLLPSEPPEAAAATAAARDRLASPPSTLAAPVPTAALPTPFARQSCEEGTLARGRGCEAGTEAASASDSAAWAGAAETADITQTAPARSAGRPQPLMPMLPRFSQPTSAHPAVAVSETQRWVARPQNGSQLYAQRQAALQAGQLFTRVAPGAFQERWERATEQPTYQQWQALLAQEARAVTAGQGRNRLTVVVGDSLSLWLPSEALPRDRFWLNQSISGETTAQILNRLGMFASTRPDTIYVMAGVNDLKNGASNAEVVNNLRLMTQRLRQQHPEARIVVHSILPTRLADVPSTRVRLLNQLIGYAVRQQGGEFLDLQPQFMDAQGNLSSELTTDGLHLNPQGYRVWQMSMLAI